jgi:hypothetical protein
MPEELPPRPRRRFLAPLPIALLGVLLIACGFIGGVLVEKSQSSSSISGSGASGVAARFAALRSAGGGATTGGSPSGGAGSGGGGFAGGFAGRFGGAGGGAVIGEVAYIQGHNLYVTNAEGNTVKVTTSAASAITKTVSTDVHGIHPGDTVIVRGPKGSSGALSAESITVSTGATAGLGGGGGLSSLFGSGSGSSK